MTKNKVAIITGAGCGIGSTIAVKLNKEKFITILVGRNKKNLIKTASKRKKNVVVAVADISKEKDVVGIFKKVIQKFGRIDVLINNAGSSVFEKFDKISGENLRKTVNTNLLGTLYCAKEAVKQMKKQPFGGQIVNISSIAAKIPSVFPSRGVHCATKAAIGAFSESVQSETSTDRKKIKIATIYPGLVFTEAAAKRATRDFQELKKYALKSEDIACVVWTIVNQGENSNITEVVIQPLFTPAVVSKR